MAVDNTAYRGQVHINLVGTHTVSGGAGVITVPQGANALYFQMAGKFTLDGSDPATNGFATLATDTFFLREPLCLPRDSVFRTSAACTYQFCYVEGDC